MTGSDSAVSTSRSSRSMRLRRTILALFGPEAKAAALQMWSAGPEDWRGVASWLDSSGMALYLLARMHELEISFLLPPALHARLEQNMVDNTSRTAWLLEQMSDLTIQFQRAAIPFAFLKGITLVPHSVPDPRLRCQTDIDILASSKHESVITAMLLERGYVLHANGNGTSEFRTASTRLVSVDERYMIRPQRAIELHWVRQHATEAQRASVWPEQLIRAQVRKIGGVAIPCLSRLDQFINQALHLFGHLRSEHTRASWIVEFARHIETRRHDAAFWERLRVEAGEIPDARLACGVSFAVVEKVLLSSPPACMASWIDELPKPVSHWVNMYATRVASADAPGSKLYLILERALAANDSGAKALVDARLVPHRLPPMVMLGTTGESVAERIRRYGTQLWFIYYRLRFHLRQLFVYRIELFRWKKQLGSVEGRSNSRLQRNDNQATAV